MSDGFGFSSDPFAVDNNNNDPFAVDNSNMGFFKDNHSVSGTVSTKSTTASWHSESKRSAKQGFETDFGGMDSGFDEPAFPEASFPEPSFADDSFPQPSFDNPAPQREEAAQRPSAGRRQRRRSVAGASSLADLPDSGKSRRSAEGADDSRSVKSSRSKGSSSSGSSKKREQKEQKERRGSNGASGDNHMGDSHHSNPGDVDYGYGDPNPQAAPKSRRSGRRKSVGASEAMLAEAQNTPSQAPPQVDYGYGYDEPPPQAPTPQEVSKARRAGRRKSVCPAETCMTENMSSNHGEVDYGYGDPSPQDAARARRAGRRRSVGGIQSLGAPVQSLAPAAAPASSDVDYGYGDYGGGGGKLQRHRSFDEDFAESQQHPPMERRRSGRGGINLDELRSGDYNGTSGANNNTAMSTRNLGGNTTAHNIMLPMTQTQPEKAPRGRRRASLVGALDVMGDVVGGAVGGTIGAIGSVGGAVTGGLVGGNHSSLDDGEDNTKNTKKGFFKDRKSSKDKPESSSGKGSTSHASRDRERRRQGTLLERIDAGGSTGRQPSREASGSYSDRIVSGR